MRKRIFKDNKSGNFWSVSIEDKIITVECSSDEEAEINYEKMIREKLKKGYIEITDKVTDDIFGKLIKNLQINQPLLNDNPHIEGSLTGQIDRLKKRAWRPVVKEVDGAQKSSKFCGTPYLSKGERWPLCAGCNRPLQFFLQINCDELPLELKNRFGKGLIQLFYCTWCTDSRPFSDTMLVRLIEPSGRGRNVKIPDDVDYYPPRLITGWLEIESEFPGFDEMEKIIKEENIELNEEEEEYMYGLVSPSLGDKLGGWPYWIQTVEYPSCPVCEREMKLVFQIDSEDSIPYSFGEGGCAIITQCSEHKDQVAFSWTSC